MNSQMSASTCNAPDYDDILGRKTTRKPLQIAAESDEVDPTESGLRLLGRVVSVSGQKCGGLCVSNAQLAHAFGQQS